MQRSFVLVGPGLLCLVLYLSVYSLGVIFHAYFHCIFRIKSAYRPAGLQLVWCMSVCLLHRVSFEPIYIYIYIYLQPTRLLIIAVATIDQIIRLGFALSNGPSLSPCHTSLPPQACWLSFVLAEVCSRQMGHPQQAHDHITIIRGWGRPWTIGQQGPF